MNFVLNGDCIFGKYKQCASVWMKGDIGVYVYVDIVNVIILMNAQSLEVVLLLTSCSESYEGKLHSKFFIYTKF